MFLWKRIDEFVRFYSQENTDSMMNTDLIIRKVIIEPVSKMNKNTPYLSVSRAMRHRAASEVKANFTRPRGVETRAILMPGKTDLRSCSRWQFDLRRIQSDGYICVFMRRGKNAWKEPGTRNERSFLDFREKRRSRRQRHEIRDIRKVGQRATFREVNRGSERKSFVDA